MICPECRLDTFEPFFSETLNPYLDDHPLTRKSYESTRKELHHFLCRHCRACYFVCGGESIEQAYRRILREQRNT